jgi:hypothetical protein
MDLDEPRTFLFVAVGLEVQSDRVLTRLFPDQVAITFGLEVIKELQPVVVASCLVSLKPFVQFFLWESRNWTRSRWADGRLADGGGLLLSYHNKVPHSLILNGPVFREQTAQPS